VEEENRIKEGGQKRVFVSLKGAWQNLLEGGSCKTWYNKGKRGEEVPGREGHGKRDLNGNSHHLLTGPIKDSEGKRNTDTPNRGESWT